MGEGFQRFAMQHQIKLNRLTDILLTRNGSEAAGGLPGATGPSLSAASLSYQGSTRLMCAAAVSKKHGSVVTAGPVCCAGLCLTISDVLGGGAASPAHHLSFHGPTVRITCANPCALQYALSWEVCMCAWLVVYVLMLESMSKAGTGCFMHRVLQICSMRCASM